MSSWNTYRNLNDGCWSIQPPWRGSKVIHADRLVVRFPRFVVQPAGNAKVRAERRKNVHAFVRSRGKPIAVVRDVRAAKGNWVRVTYNPYQDTAFVDAATGAAVISAAVAVLDADGRCYVEAPVYEGQEEPA